MVSGFSFLYFCVSRLKLVNNYRAFVSVILICLFLNSCVCAQQSDAKTKAQIELLLKEKQQRSPSEKKIASQLVQAIREHQGKKLAKGIDLAPANVNADSLGNLSVDITGEVSDLLLRKIQDVGGTIVFSSVEYHSITANVNLTKVEAIARLPEVKFIQPSARASTSGGNRSPAPETRQESSDKPVKSETNQKKSKTKIFKKQTLIKN